MDIGNVDAIDFTFGGKKHIRVYYQTKDKQIRETSYESQNGWFVRQESRIPGNAKAESPIIATRWVNDNKVQIRVYFVDENKKICEIVGEYTTNGTVWTSGNPLPLHGGKTTNVADTSQLAVARPDRDEETLRVFYQEPRTPDNKYPIREIRYKKNVGTWTLQDKKIQDAAQGSRLSAVSAGKAWNVHLYFQGAGTNLLKSSYWDNNKMRWEDPENVQGEHKLAPAAPIVATCWYAGDASDSENLRIRIYTILDSAQTTIVEKALNGGEWEDPRGLTTISNSTPGTASIGVSREKSSADDVPIFVFYKPDPSYIDIAFPNPAMTEAAKNSFRPRGIPTSR